MTSSDIVVMIPTYRPPPVTTLESYPHSHPFIIVADPKVAHLHEAAYGARNVVTGVQGMVPQVARCYKVAWDEGYPWFVRLDDDLDPKTFVTVRRGPLRYPKLDEVIAAAWICARDTQTSLVGFHNGGAFIGDGYGRSFGLVTGGASLARSTAEEWRYLDPRLVAYEDVYRSCAHREEAGAVGRVRWIGFDKRKAAVPTTNIRAVQPDIDRILNRFPGYVTCKGTREIAGGYVIANWRMRRQPGYRKELI